MSLESIQEDMDIFKKILKLEKKVDKLTDENYFTKEEKDIIYECLFYKIKKIEEQLRIINERENRRYSL